MNKVLALLAIVVLSTIFLILLSMFVADMSAVIFRRATKRLPPPPKAPRAEPETFRERVAYVHERRMQQLTDSSLWAQARAFHEVFFHK